MNQTAATMNQPTYRLYLGAAFSQSLVTMVRRKRIALAMIVTLTPVLIPLAIAFLSLSAFSEDGNRIFVYMVEQLHLKALAPLLALFYGCMLIGEDVESQTIPYVLTRPIPRSAIVLGRLGAYLALAAAMLITSIVLTFAACTSLGGLSFAPETLKLLAHYVGVAFAALLGYGAVTLFLGALSKRPVILGIALLFGWQRLAMIVPGAVDFLTIEKYLNAMLPKLATERQSTVIRAALVEFQKKQLMIDASKAAVTLLIIVVVLVAITCFVIRHREYSQSRAIGI